ncbi:F-box/kelch-repeat protein At3g06240, partial [Linum perenne]
MGIFLLGSCHGLICFSLMYTVTNPNDIILLNPSTGDLHDFPSFKSTEESRKSPWLASYGFGYDELTDDYKVVMMMTVDLDYYSVEIYHVRAKSFTRKHGLQLGHWMSTHDHEQMGVFVGGALHWRIGDMKMPKYYILALDLGSETFRYIPQPDYGEMWCEMMSIGVVDECLCVCVLHKRSGGEIDIWVMDEYGDIDSWCLVVGIEDYVPKSVVSISWNGGQIVLKLDGFVLVWCDQREKNLYQVVRSRLEDGYYRVIYCLESLVKVCPNRSPEVDVHDKQVRRKEEHKAKLVEQDKSSNVSNSDGQICDGRFVRFLSASPIASEARAILEATRYAASSLLSCVILSDCKTLIYCLRGPKGLWSRECFGTLGSISSLLSSSPTTSNYQADWVAKHARLGTLPCNWLGLVPLSMT